MKRTLLVGLAFGMSLLGARGASAGNPTWTTLLAGMNSSKRPALTTGWGPGSPASAKVHAYAIDSGGAVVAFSIDQSTRAFRTIPLGGLTQKAPAAAEWSGHQEVLVVGNDNASIWRNMATDEVFGTWQKVLGTPPGTTICSDPSAASWGPNRVDLYVVGCDGTLRHAWTNNGNWAWDNRGAPSVSGLAFDPGPQVLAPAYNFGRLDVWVKDAWGVLWDNQYASSSFAWRQTEIPATTDFAAAPLNVTNGGGYFDTTLAVGILRRASTWKPNANAGNVAGVTTQPSWPMHYADVQTSGPFSTVTATKQGDTAATMYGLVNGRVIRKRLQATVDGANHPINPIWQDDGQDLFNTGKVLTGKMSVVTTWWPGQNRNFVFGFEGASLVFANDYSSI